MKSTFVRISALVASTLMLVSCGGSDADRETPLTVVGPISAFGSVVVGGRRFDDSQATVVMDGAVRTREQLRVGMVVQVQARVRSDGTAVADRVQYDKCVEGPVTAVNREQNTLMVMGQTVEVDGETQFDGVTLRDMNAFAIGDVVEVSCLPARTQDRMRATRVERKGIFANGSTEVAVSGAVANLALSQGTCTVGGLKLDFSAMPAASRPIGLANGMLVEAMGRSIAGGVLLVERLRDRDRDRTSLPDGDLMEIEGQISGFVSTASFNVDGTVVNASNAIIRNGTAADLRNGIRVEVEGTMSNGVLLAQRVVIRLQVNVQVEAGMQSKDLAQNLFNVLGQPLLVVPDTVITDRSSNPRQPQLTTLAALNTGDRLEVRALRNASGQLVAARVERTAPDALVVVKGPADARTPITRMTLAGFQVATGAGTRYRDLAGTLVEATAFYGLVSVPPAIPSIVHARGVVANLSTSIVDATRSTSTTGELELAQE